MDFLELEDFTTCQHIIYLDAIWANAEWAVYSPNPVAFGREMALQPAFSVGLRDYDHLDPCMIYHAACLVAVLESYAVYDPQIHI